MDGFTIRRTGDLPTKIRIILYLENFPEQYKVLPELGLAEYSSTLHGILLTVFLFYLGTVLGIKEESRLGVVQTLWNYIKVQGLQDKVDRRLIRADDKLRPVSSLILFYIIQCLREQFQIFGVEPVIFQKLPEIVNRYLAASDPIVLHYNLNPAVPPPDRPSAWDVELKIEDSALKNRMAVTVNTSKESAQALLKLDEEVCFYSCLCWTKTVCLSQIFPTFQTRSLS